MITNENDFLGLLIANADESHNCDAWTVVKKSELPDIDCLPFIKSLEAKGLIKMTSTTNIHVYPQAYEAYVGIAKKIKKSAAETTKFTLKTLLEIIVGIIITVIAGGIIYYLGWQ